MKVVDEQYEFILERADHNLEPSKFKKGQWKEAYRDFHETISSCGSCLIGISGANSAYLLKSLLKVPGLKLYTAYVMKDSNDRGGFGEAALASKYGVEHAHLEDSNGLLESLVTYARKKDIPVILLGTAIEDSKDDYYEICIFNPPPRILMPLHVTGLQKPDILYEDNIISLCKCPFCRAFCKVKKFLQQTGKRKDGK